MADLVIMRHGRVRNWETRRYLGRTDEPLDDHGRAQARWWGRRIAKDSLAAIWCSGLSRSVETARLVAEGVGLPELRLRGEISEIDLGDWDGRSFEEIRRSDPEGFAARGGDLVNFRPHGGESFADLARRAIPAMEEILSLAAGSDRDHLLVGHLGVNRVFLAHILGMDPANLMRIAQDYACLSRIRPAKGGPRLVTLNLTPELLSAAWCEGETS